MNTQAFGLSMDVEPSVLPTPPLVLQKPGPSTDIEMKPLNQDARKKGPGSKPGSFTQTPMASRTLNELEMSRSPGAQNGVDIVQTFWNPYMNRFRLAAACIISLGLGLNDSSSGALLAYIEKEATPLMEHEGQLTDINAETITSAMRLCQSSSYLKLLDLSVQLSLSML